MILINIKEQLKELQEDNKKMEEKENRMVERSQLKRINHLKKDEKIYKETIKMANISSGFLDFMINSLFTTCDKVYYILTFYFYNNKSNNIVTLTTS